MWLPLTAVAGSVLIVVAAAATTTATATAIASATATGWPTFYLHTQRRVDGPPDERAQTDGQPAYLFMYRWRRYFNFNCIESLAPLTG